VPPASGMSDPELANGESPDYYRKMDRRLIILETRFDTILPTLATKTDLLELKAELKQEIRDSFSELRGNLSGLKDTISAQDTRMVGFHGDIRAEMRDLKAEMHKWMTATIISLFIGFASLAVAVIRQS
jgi:hypothetical protein